MTNQSSNTTGARGLESVEWVSIDSVVLDPSNARKRDEKNLEAIKGSLAKFGQKKPIVVSRATNIVLAGNGTIKAARALGWDKICVAWSDGSPVEETAYALADNRTAELASWDLDVLPDLLESLQADDFDVSSIGFDEDFLDALPKEVLEPETHGDPDEVPEQVDTRCQPGDLWILGEHRLLCGDSTNVQHVERLMAGAKADMVFTSPPYNASTNITGGFNKKGKIRNHKPLYINNETDNKTESEYIDFNRSILSLILLNLNENSPVFYNINYNKNSPESWLKIISNATAEGFHLAETIIWEKHLAVSLVGSNLTRIYEFIFLLSTGKKKPEMYKESPSECVKNLWKISNVGANHEDHKACFPVALPSYAIGYYSRPNDLLYEPFSGSGSTLIACEKTGRRCYGMEIDPHYCDVILTRWEKFTGKTAVLEESA